MTVLQLACGFGKIAANGTGGCEHTPLTQTAAAAFEAFFLSNALTVLLSTTSHLPNAQLSGCSRPAQRVLARGPGGSVHTAEPGRMQQRGQRPAPDPMTL